MINRWSSDDEHIWRWMIVDLGLTTMAIGMIIILHGYDYNYLSNNLPDNHNYDDDDDE